MPKYNEVNVDEEIEKEIQKDDVTNKYYMVGKAKIATDRKARKADDPVFHLPVKYEEYYTDYADLNTGVFCEAMGLKKGILVTKADPHAFNDALKKTMTAGFRKKGYTHDTDKKLVTGKYTNHYFINKLSKEDIIEYAKEKRNECFSLLMGTSPDSANPAFVKNYRIKNADGTVSYKLGYDNKAINRLVSNFQSDDDLYQSAIASISCHHFREAYEQIRYCPQVINEEEVKTFGRGYEGVVNARECVNTYLNLKEIHESRPWYYRFLNPVWNWWEGAYLEDYKDKVTELARGSGVEEEVSACLNAKKNNRAELVDALETSYREKLGLPSSENNKEEKVQIEISKNEIEPSDSLDTSSELMEKFNDLNKEHEEIVIHTDAEIEPFDYKKNPVFAPILAN